MVCASVIIADRYPLFVCGVVSVLSKEPDFNIAASCCDGLKCLQAIRDLSPDVALLDISLPGLSGLEMLTTISFEGLSARVVLCGASAEQPELVVGAASGAYGVVLKDTAPAGIVQCLRHVAAGYRMLPQAPLVSEPGTQQGRFSETVVSETELAPLTRRERQIVRLVSQGLTNKEIGHELEISTGTIRVHLHTIFQKLAIRNRTALAALVVSR
jgi:two-component system, NarL family, nitrate/nitrite response regulator NarL